MSGPDRRYDLHDKILELDKALEAVRVLRAEVTAALDDLEIFNFAKELMRVARADTRLRDALSKTAQYAGEG